MQKNDFAAGADPAGGAYSTPPDPLAGFKGPTSKGRGKWEGEGGEEGGEGEEGERGKVLPPTFEGWRRHWGQVVEIKKGVVLQIADDLQLARWHSLPDLRKRDDVHWLAIFRRQSYVFSEL